MERLKSEGSGNPFIVRLADFLSCVADNPGFYGIAGTISHWLEAPLREEWLNRNIFEPLHTSRPRLDLIPIPQSSAGFQQNPGICRNRETFDRIPKSRPHKEGGFIADWIEMLDEAREPIARELGTTGREAERAMEQAAVKVSLKNLRTFPCVREKEKRGELVLRGAFFAISDGVLYLLNESTGRFVTA